MTQPMIRGRGSLGDSVRLREFSKPVRVLAHEVALALHIQQKAPDVNVAELLKKAGRRATSPSKMRDIRKDCGMSEREFAAFLGENVRTIRDWEAGRAKPNRMALVVFHLLDELA